MCLSVKFSNAEIHIDVLSRDFQYIYTRGGGRPGEYKGGEGFPLSRPGCGEIGSSSGGGFAAAAAVVGGIVGVVVAAVAVAVGWGE